KTRVWERTVQAIIGFVLRQRSITSVTRPTWRKDKLAWSLSLQGARHVSTNGYSDDNRGVGRIYRTPHRWTGQGATRLANQRLELELLWWFRPVIGPKLLALLLQFLHRGRKRHSGTPSASHTSASGSFKRQCPHDRADRTTHNAPDTGAGPGAT